MSKKLINSISDINDSAKEYFQTKVDLTKVSLLEKSTKLTSYVINVWILATFITWILGFAVAAFALWYGEKYNNYSEGLLIAAGVMCFATLLFVIFRKRIVTSAVLQYFSEIIFEDENDKKA